MAQNPSKRIEQVRERLESHRGKPLSSGGREKEAVELAALMLQEALKIQTHSEKKTQAEIARMMKDPRGKAFTIMLTDACFRSTRNVRIADQLLYLLHQFGIPRYLNAIKRLQFSLFRRFGKSLYFILVPLLKRALRKAMSKVILPGEKRALFRQMKRRREKGLRLNLNHLGEAILGEKEASRRLDLYLKDLEQRDVQYLSIKISTLYSQIDELDWDETMEILKNRLRLLYRKAKEHGKKFINLDMEEYKDLHVTKELFKQVLMEEEFLDYSAGIALQAYLPDSYPIFQEITEWALARRQKGGAPIVVRIVKGANLAMEKVDASIHIWPQAPYPTKTEVDANYKRMILYGCQKTHADAVNLGIASHNLFDVAFAMLVRIENEVEKEVSFEMLEGMADHVRRTIQQLTGNILLYCPVATKKDFQSAIAYLIRRLDENTGPDNFLRHSFELQPGNEAWKTQVDLFSKACHSTNTISSQPRRTQSRFDPPEKLDIDAPFQNEANTDFALPQNQQWAWEVIHKWEKMKFDLIPLVIGGEDVYRDQKGEGIEPANPHATLYQYSLATWEDIDHALEAAKRAEVTWSKTPVQKRCELLSQVAQNLREKWGDLIGVMMQDGGKSIQEADPEIAETIDFVEYYLRNMMELEAIEDIGFYPLGTVLITPPWNFPISIPCGGIVASLVAGNCVIFKPAPEAVLSGWILVNILWDAGIPKEALQFVNCVDDPVGSQLIKDERVNGVVLTGATSTASLFMKMRPNLHLCGETGGKNAIIITGMSDKDLAIKDLVQSAFGHSGQKCSAASLAILEAEVYDDKNFMRQLKDAVESLPVGSNWKPSSKVIPLIRPPSDDLHKGLTTLESGEKWLVKPKQDPNNPHLFSPGVKLGVKEGSFMHQTELFGPCLGIMRAKNLDEAIHFANGTPYGLTSGIHSLDKREINTWMKKIEAGNCYINRTITGAIVRRQSFGGCKASCFGHGSKAGGPNYLFQLMRKSQMTLPKEKAPVTPRVNDLTRFIDNTSLSPEELGVWYVSTASYAHFAKYFSKDHDPSKVVGQDNFLRYVPRKNMAYRIQKGDHPLDLFRILAAALSCKVHLEVSYHPAESPVEINNEWHQVLQGLHFTQETLQEFIARMQWGSFDCVRLASQPDEEIQQASSEIGLYLNTEPILANGRIELTHYLREIVFSYDYHRYGNLGLREAEERSPIV